MCSLFHAFMFAQLWTIYCEQAAAAPSPLNQNQTEFSSSALLTGLEFWSRVTPSIMQLMAHNKVVSALPLGSKLAQIRGLIMCFRSDALIITINHVNILGILGIFTVLLVIFSLRW